jgi:formylglycine-generating enzyme required for sulfatase activity
VIEVSWDDAKAYVNWLKRETGHPYGLLSEAEWEYACRAGTTTPYSWGDEITPENANYGRNVGKTTEVNTYPANPWGLHDMHGNVWEWVEDCWNDSYQGAPSDGSAWTSGDCSRRVLRGGSWFDEPVLLRSAIRFRNLTGLRVNGSGGFRVARTLSLRESVTP